MAWSDLSAGEKLTADKFNERMASWVILSGVAAPAVIRDSHNVSSVDDNGTGDYTINWDEDFADSDYAVVGTTHNKRYVSISALSDGGSVSIYVATDAGALDDRNPICVIAMGDRT